MVLNCPGPQIHEADSMHWYMPFIQGSWPFLNFGICKGMGVGILESVSDGYWIITKFWGSTKLYTDFLLHKEMVSTPNPHVIQGSVLPAFPSAWRILPYHFLWLTLSFESLAQLSSSQRVLPWSPHPKQNPNLYPSTLAIVTYKLLLFLSSVEPINTWNYAICNYWSVCLIIFQSFPQKGNTREKIWLSSTVYTKACSIVISSESCQKDPKG